MNTMRVMKNIAREKPANEVIMDRELDRILQGRLLTPLFMPIANTRERQVLGYEALIRGRRVARCTLRRACSRWRTVPLDCWSLSCCAAKLQSGVSSISTCPANFFSMLPGDVAGE